MVFYRKYRPQKFAEIIGQDHVVETLLGQLTSGKIAHGYLFSGPKGTGKTSAARILAKAVNCKVYSSQSTVHSKEKSVNREQLTVNKFGEPCNKCTSCLAITDGSALDLIEIDAASNRNIDDIRDLREKIKLVPVSSRFKVYIIDEVHMLTREAFNALLKTLEEPPAHALFILATTEISKLPPTILSRVQKFKFVRADDKKLGEVIGKVAGLEGIKLDSEAQVAIAKASDGSYRDALSLLEQVSGGRQKIKSDDVLAIAQVSDWQLLWAFIEDLTVFNLSGVVKTIEDVYQEGGDIAHLTRELVLIVEKILFIKIGVALESLNLDSDRIQKLRELSLRLSLQELQNLMRLFLVAEGEIKLYPLPQIPLILAVCKYCLAQRPEPDIRQKPVLPESGEEKISKQAQEEQELPNRNKGAARGKSLAKIEKHWSEFLSKVRLYNTHVMAILRSARPVTFDGADLTCEVFYRFHKEKLEEPKIALELDKFLKETLGQTIKLKFVLAKRQVYPPKPVVESDVVDIVQEDLERVAREIFSK